MLNLSAVGFEPDCKNMLDAARNIEPRRSPIYEHSVSLNVISEIIGNDISKLYETTDLEEHRELMAYYNDFWRQMGYDTVTWEIGITDVMPGNGALGAHMPGTIKTRADFDKYPWDYIEKLYFDKWSTHFDILKETMQEGMNESYWWPR